MSNTINVNYMTRAYNQYQQKNAAKDQEKEDTRFADSVREKSEASGSIVGNSKIGSVSAKDMTMVEYKQYIYNKISQIPMHPTRAGESISVTISEAGFEAMKNDPEYEAWVLNDLQVGWSQPDKWSGICGGAFSTIYYGASKEECHAEMWSAGYNNGNGGKIFNDSKLISVEFKFTNNGTEMTTCGIFGETGTDSEIDKWLERMKEDKEKEDKKTENMIAIEATTRNKVGFDTYA